MEAMDDEIGCMARHKVWHLVPLPEDKKPIRSRWVFTIKKDELGNIARFKARLVAQGYSQIKGDTYEETFSPVVNFSIVRFFFSLLVAHLNWANIQCDIKSAYLYAPLTNEIYMDQPQGYVDTSKPDFVSRLDKATYGLHQSGRLWLS